MPKKFRSGDNRREAAGGLAPGGQAGAALANGGHPTRQPARTLRNALLLAAIVLILVLAWAWNSLGERTLVGSAYAARVGCMCRYVSQRSLKSCEGDLAIAPIGRMNALISLSDDPKERAVSAGIPLLARQTARYSERFGCRLDPWDD